MGDYNPSTIRPPSFSAVPLPKSFGSFFTLLYPSSPLCSEIGLQVARATRNTWSLDLESRH